MAVLGREVKPQLSFLGCMLLALTIIWMSCDSAPTSQPDIPAAEHSIVVPQFDEDSAYAYVARQVEFGPRVPNTQAHAECAQWLANELSRHGAEVTVQEARARAFDGTVLEMKNIIGTFHPESRDRILLFAHWDTRPFADKDSVRTREPIDGANDGASGVGVLLEVARQLGLESADVGVDIQWHTFHCPEGLVDDELLKSARETRRVLMNRLAAPRKPGSLPASIVIRKELQLWAEH